VAPHSAASACDDLLCTTGLAGEITICGRQGNRRGQSRRCIENDLHMRGFSFPQRYTESFRDEQTLRGADSIILYTLLDRCASLANHGSPEPWFFIAALPRRPAALSPMFPRRSESPYGEMILASSPDSAITGQDMWAPKLSGTEALSMAGEHFVDCIEHGKVPETDGKLGMRVVELIEAATSSMRKEGQTVYIQR
jgi:hypothetical protein